MIEKRRLKNVVFFFQTIQVKVVKYLIKSNQKQSPHSLQLLIA